VKILVAIYSSFAVWNIPASYVEGLSRAFPRHTFLHATTEAEALALIADADVIFAGQVDRSHLAAATALRWIHSPAAGVGGMLYPEMVARPIVITNSRGMSADTIGEHVVAVTMALFRRLPLAIRRQVQHDWAMDEISAPPGNRTIAGSRALIVGLGAIGTAAGRRLADLGAEVSAIRRNTSAPGPPWLHELGSPDQMRALLPRADIVAICAPETSGTQRFIGAAELAAMRPEGVLVNVSRGKLVDESALVEALRSGAIAGAALDVFEHEPLNATSPLWDLPNVLITPHTSGFRVDHWDAATALFSENLRRFDAGQPLLNVVDKQAGY
jgi:phosphoglycerate dehydrogenase-like enzyme